MKEYKQIPTFENYGISTDGEVKNLKTGKVLKTLILKDGYMAINLSTSPSKSTCIKIHKVLAMTYMGHIRCGFKEVVDHINNDKLDNRLENLQLITNRLNVSKDRNRKLPTGVYQRRNNKYISIIQINKKSICLGTFDTPEAAHAAYLAAIPN